jgi:hypothetical protein
MPLGSFGERPEGGEMYDRVERCCQLAFGGAVIQEWERASRTPVRMSTNDDPRRGPVALLQFVSRFPYHQGGRVPHAWQLVRN